MAEETKTEMGLAELHDWVFSELGFCGCGDPEAALDHLKAVLSAIRKRSNENRAGDKRDRWAENSRTIDDLIGMKSVPAMAWTYLYFLDGNGLLEHGTNITGSWLTEDGEKILGALLKYDSGAIIEGEGKVRGE